MVALAPEGGGRAIGLAVDDIGDVAEHGRVEDAEDRLVVVMAALRAAAHTVARGDREGGRRRVHLGSRIGRGRGGGAAGCGATTDRAKLAWRE